ncbi:MAG: carboxymuconolactone decarboxylase family protein [Paludisphaera borealis]|uniref:carboxymuconolactone decarboxylase family protein n=1 Tax=Paludisphaera borealis TaxID=1387353 RepID=UPI00283EC7E3|nr:carboxymuconolactone decarboxylase family protein [Paludisphaera borealis]MDR3620608.1 carboxymuconolactone decarboxylase family protein [Paludisphaera borealis]
MRKTATLAVGLMFASAGIGKADEPRPVPLTRPEMKRLIEDMKARKPRIPLPELTEAEKAKLGERGAGYESRIRALYLPAGEGFGYGGNRPTTVGNAAGRARGDANRGAAPAGAGPEFARNADPNMSLDGAFKVELFWIASRANNCQYCLGHQEGKLLRAGLKEDEIAALDGDWSEFNPAQRKAFAFARKLTYEPHTLSDADIDGLRKDYQDLQILEMILSVAGNNAINRWKEGAGVPQSQGGGGFGRRTESGEVAVPAAPAAAHTYLTPTSEKFQSLITKVAPVVNDSKTGEPTKLTVCNRPPLESRADVAKALETARARTPRLPLVDDAKARAIVSSTLPDGPLPQWVRLAANFPREGANRITAVLAADEKGDLKPLLKAQASWIIARQDRAWYAAGVAQRRLKELGQTDDQIAALDGDWSEFSPVDRAMFTVARKLAASPVVLTDSEVDAAVKLAGPRDVVQLISFTTTRAWFDRVTEAAGLQLEK